MNEGSNYDGLYNRFLLKSFIPIGFLLLFLAGLGLTIVVVLAAQTLFTVAFVIFVLFPLLGRGYRAAVLAAGFSGFALGATPTAIANMSAVTKRYGPSPIAFVVLPLVSAFFVDIANAIVIQKRINTRWKPFNSSKFSSKSVPNRLQIFRLNFHV